MFNLELPYGMNLSTISKLSLLKWIRDNVKTYDGRKLCLTSSKALAELVLDAYKKGKQA